ncbi:MAG TPA: flagellar filament capping protein FliD, partial [Phycisphaeraceae bacterium]
STVDSGNLQFKYITGATRLDQLGITRGKFIITDSSGASATVDLTQGDEVTIDDVLREINSRGLQINARINDTGDGILIEDLGPGAGKLKVEEAGSTTAADLGILGEAENPGDDLNGSFEKTLTIDASATLENVVTAINEAGVGVTASILNDGSAGAPYRLILSAKEAGTGGAFVFDDGGAGWGAATLSQAQDALVFFGPPDPAQALLITSKSNKLVNAVPGTTIDLHATSSSPVQLTISKDADKITQAASDFVTKFNEVVTAMDKYDTYDSEKQERGLLLGDSAVAAVRRALYNLVIKRDTQDLSGQYQSLAQVGITIGSGAKLEFDEGKFLTALDNDPDAVAALFTFKQTEEDEVTGETTITASGIGVEIDELLKRLTDSEIGVIQLRVDAIDDQIELNNKRLASLDQLLAAKRAKLEAEFLAMERALATLQQQSQALGSFQTALAGNKKSASNS